MGSKSNQFFTLEFSPRFKKRCISLENTILVCIPNRLFLAPHSSARDPVLLISWLARWTSQACALACIQYPATSALDNWCKIRRPFLREVGAPFFVKSGLACLFSGQRGRIRQRARKWGSIFGSDRWTSKPFYEKILKRVISGVRHYFLKEIGQTLGSSRELYTL